MSLWDKARSELVDIIEWTDETSDTMVYRFPRHRNEIKNGAQLIVRHSQAAVLVDQGKIADVFPPGRHSLTTSNLPVLATLKGWKYGFESPFKAEVYFLNTKNFTNLKWGTKNPVIIRDPEFGPVRLRSFGTYVVRISDPARFTGEITGTDGHFTIDEVTEQLRNLIVARFSDLLGESAIPVLDLAANYDELSKFLTTRIAPEFQEYGLTITKLLVENISLPQEVEAALDKKSSMGIIGNLDKYMTYQTAEAMEAAAKNPGGDAAAGVGMGMGFAMAGKMERMTGQPREKETAKAPPPLPDEQEETSYYVGKNGKKAGPLQKRHVDHYIKKGAITPKTLMWKEGMESWEPAGNFREFKNLFRATPPPLPKDK